MLPILGRRTKERRPTDIDLLDAGIAAEVVQVADDDVDELNALLVARLDVLGLVAVGKDAAGDLGIDGLQSAVHHLREARDLFHRNDVKAQGNQVLERAGRRDDREIKRVTQGEELLQSFLVGDADQYAQFRFLGHGFPQFVHHNLLWPRIVPLVPYATCAKRKGDRLTAFSFISPPQQSPR